MEVLNEITDLAFKRITLGLVVDCGDTSNNTLIQTGDNSLLEVIVMEVLEVFRFWIYFEDRANRIAMDWIWILGEKSR